MTPSNEKAAGGGAVELPPLPKSTACLWVTDNPAHCSLLRPAPNVVNAFPWPADSKPEADRDYWRAKGFWQEPLFTAAQMDDHAESALKLQADRIAELEGALEALRRSHGVDGHSLTVAQLLTIDAALSKTA